MSDELKLNSRQGDFVHNNQTMAKAEGFGNVSRLWWEKTIPISQGIDSIIDEAKEREDITDAAKMMRFRLNDDDGMTLELEYIDGRRFQPTEHAWEQIAKHCDVSIQHMKNLQTNPLKPNGKVKYKRDHQDAELLLNTFINGYRRIDQTKKFRFRTYKDGTLRAMLTDSYTIINNLWYLEVLQDLFHKDIGGVEPRLSHWKGNADTIYGNLLIPDKIKQKDDGDYGGMVSLSNCEIGIRRLSQYPSIFRAICMNGCIWDQSKGNIISQVHRGDIDIKALEKKIALNIHTQLPLMDDAIERFMATRERKFVDVKFPQVLVELSNTYKLSGGMKGQASQVLRQWNTHEKDNKNMFGVINSITRAGQEFDPKTWVQFDNIAGDMVNYTANQWEYFLSRARTRSEKDVQELLGIGA